MVTSTKTCGIIRELSIIEKPCAEPHWQLKTLKNRQK